MPFNILCIFFTEFDIKTGANIIYQTPNYLKMEEFNIISDFIIPNSELCNKIISVKLGNSYLLGYPITLSNQIYDRVRYQFNFCILLPKNEYEKNYYLYDLILKKISITFENKEIDLNFKFIKKNYNIIKNFLDNIFKHIKSKNDTIDFFVNLKNQDKIEFFFKYINYKKLKNKIKPYKVPIWIKVINLTNIKYLGINIEMVIKTIDGIKSIKEISDELNINLDYVELIITNLIALDYLILIDVFDINNRYKANSTLKELDIEKLYNEYNNFIKISNNHIIDEIQNLLYSENDIDRNIENNELTPIQLYCYYIELNNSKNVLDFLEKFETKNLIINLFIAFGLYKKIIYKINKYYIYKYNNEIDINKNEETFIEMLNGNYCYEEICYKNNLTYDEFENKANLKNCFIIYK